MLCNSGATLWLGETTPLIDWYHLTYRTCAFQTERNARISRMSCHAFSFRDLYMYMEGSKALSAGELTCRMEYRFWWLNKCFQKHIKIPVQRIPVYHILYYMYRPVIWVVNTRLWYTARLVQDICCTILHTLHSLHYNTLPGTLDTLHYSIYIHVSSP
jgi:hypothetical protein